MQLRDIPPDYWQQKVPMEEIPKWYFSLPSATESNIERILSMTRQEWNHYLTVALDPPMDEDSYIYHRATPEEPWGYISDKPRDDSVFDLMNSATEKFDIRRLPAFGNTSEYK